MLRLLSATILLSLLCLSAPAEATTYYVRTDGNNANAGTANNAGGAWLTITKGCTTATAGDVVRVQAGTYVETASGCISGTSGNTVTIVADGVVTTCGMSFAAKSYIRVIGLIFDPSTGGCAAGHAVNGTGTNTGLEFWNVTVQNNLSNKAYNFDLGVGANRCDKCIWLGGTIQSIGGGSSSVVAMLLDGDDDFVGYLNFQTICYVGVGPAGNRQRFINLNFSGFIQCAASHPDFFYIHAISGLPYSNGLVESMYGIGTVTSTDNKGFHAQNQSTGVNWVDDVWRLNVSYNLGAAFYSMYDDPDQLLRWRFYNSTHVNCERANNNVNQDSCGNISHQLGNGVSVSIFNNIFYQGWADLATTNIAGGWSESFSPTVTKDYNLAFSPLGSNTFQSVWTGQAHPQTNVNPNLVSVGTNFTLGAGSGSGANARGTGGALTTATSCSGTTLNVATNTGSFFIGDNSANLAAYGGALVPGDFITVNSTNYQVASVAASALTLTASIACSNGDSIYYGTSTTIDIGAYPYKAGGYTLSATYALVGGTAVTITPNDASLVRFAICYENGIPTTVDNASPYTCTVTSGATLDLRVYPKYASTTLYATATTASVPVITTASPLAQQTQNVAVSGVTISGTCTDTPCVWTSDIVSSGACTGVTFTSTNSTTATIGGTPTTTGVCSFHATTTDANTLTDTDAFTMTVNAAGTGARFPALRLRIP